MMKKLCLAATLLLGLIGALSLSAAPSKQIMSLEYFYAKDGTITGRSVNGRMQTYQYDKRGQLLAVVDGKGQAVEKYVYDRAGNILEKTVNGVTTTYTYDKANQLISSTVEGKVTSYRYDAAGRLIKEGDKSYRYGYLDKVLAVYENSENTATFDYHLNGQIASATRNGETENFTWDGLALIHRGNNTFINEPYVTGGNPLLSSKGGVMFNDMLGSTLGVNGKQGVATISMSAFGETDDKSAFFTGKPAVGELGYAFLFRNYRAEQGKWQTADPLGYPDGWNNLAYVNNYVSRAVDPLGTLIVILGTKDYQDKVNVALDTIKSTPTGKLLYDQLNNSENNHIIFNGEANGTTAENPSNWTNGAGTGSDICFIPESATDGNYTSPAWNVLGHELTHSLYMDKGIVLTGETNDIPNMEVGACTEANRMLLENDPNAKTRTAYNGKNLPDSAINPPPRFHPE